MKQQDSAMITLFIRHTERQIQFFLLPDMNEPMIPSSKAAGDSGVSCCPADNFYCRRDGQSFVPFYVAALYHLDYMSSNSKYFMQNEGAPIKEIANACTPEKSYGIVFGEYHRKCIGLKRYSIHSF